MARIEPISGAFDFLGKLKYAAGFWIVLDHDEAALATFGANGAAQVLGTVLSGPIAFAATAAFQAQLAYIRQLNDTSDRKGVRLLFLPAAGVIASIERRGISPQTPSPSTGVVGHVRPPAIKGGPPTQERMLKDPRGARHVLESEAAAMLATARQGQPVSPERARDFARALLESDPVTACALSVLDGGLLMSLRAVELAGEVLAAATPADEDNGSRRVADPLAELAALGDLVGPSAQEGGGSIRA